MTATPLGVVLIVLVVLKLAHLIAWSWWLVLIPLWISLGMYSVGFALGLGMIYLAHRAVTK